MMMADEISSSQEDKLLNPSQPTDTKQNTNRIEKAETGDIHMTGRANEINQIKPAFDPSKPILLTINKPEQTNKNKISLKESSLNAPSTSANSLNANASIVTSVHHVHERNDGNVNQQTPAVEFNSEGKANGTGNGTHTAIKTLAYNLDSKMVKVITGARLQHKDVK